jgi:hypothetical protein
MSKRKTVNNELLNVHASLLTTLTGKKSGTLKKFIYI